MQELGVPEGQLWDRAVTGDGEAFGVLFDRHRDRVFRHACRLAESRQDAEDVVAVAFLELWRRRADVRLVNGSVLPWLLVTATNAGRNGSRSARRYRTFLSRLARETPVPDPAEIAEAAELDPRVRAALRDLPAADLRLFVLVVLEGYPLTEAAEVVGLTQSAAKSRLHRARLRMRGHLGEQSLRDPLVDLGGRR